MKVDFAKSSWFLRSIELPQTTPNHRKPPQTTANHILYIIIIKIGLEVGRIGVRKPPQTTFYIL